MPKETKHERIQTSAEIPELTPSDKWEKRGQRDCFDQKLHSWNEDQRSKETIVGIDNKVIQPSIKTAMNQPRGKSSQTGDPPDNIFPDVPYGDDLLPVLNVRIRSIKSVAMAGASPTQSYEPIPETHTCTMENQGDRKMKKAATESKLEVVASNGGERVGRRLERGSSSHGGQGEASLPLSQPCPQATPVVHSRNPVVELDLSRARAAAGSP